MKSSKIGWVTAGSLVVANMVGTGVFTSLGYQVVDIHNTWSIIWIWVLGMILALCGAVSYAELATHVKRSGGEYAFLTHVYHPLPGFLSGWVSLFVGFAAPVALAAMAFHGYTHMYTGMNGTVVAVAIILIIALIHSFSIRQSSLLQNGTTVLKVILILLLIAAGFYISPSESALLWDDSWKPELFTSAFAVSLLYVTYSYSGWNAATYITEEIENPGRNIPIAILGGTLFVGLIYIALNLVFLRHNPLEALQGNLEIGQLTGTALFGQAGGRWMSVAIGVMLISSISAMTWAGPRVVQVMARDYKALNWLRTMPGSEVPVRAIWFQAAIACLYVLTGTFEQVLIYSGLILQFFASLAVSAVVVIRVQASASSDNIHQSVVFKSPLYPIPQIVFLFVSVWFMGFLVFIRPAEVIAGLIVLAVGTAFWWFTQRAR
ncbi:MAG: serine/threonine exchanger SteT [Bacteroidetes bacterium HLUCCA01]|nr:MAG: serine/threonine exchanger SteT [Bacteroidetes bacterium HLUCCA01]